MRTITRSRQELIAVAAIVTSATAAGLASYLLLVGPTPRGKQFITATVPRVGGLDAVAVAALVPTAVVTAGVLSAVVFEGTRQLTAAHDRRRELETDAFDDPG
ncbi:hypothetical protein [Natronococcus wangiae]|uniref:hypothetical protein n=1 Tax=Natronococcus wangiae TaxID=3068275 RepID=UPI00273DC85C|nr:hypothetical protein [Natronococcus sp. AD5]